MAKLKNSYWKNYCKDKKFKVGDIVYYTLEGDTY